MKLAALGTMGLPPPWGNIHDYCHSIQRSSSVKLLTSQSKPNFIGIVYIKGKPMNVFITNPGHMQKVAAMTIYGKNLQKYSPELLNLLQRKEYYNLFINHDPVMTLTYFMARST